MKQTPHLINSFVQYVEGFHKFSSTAMKRCDNCSSSMNKDYEFCANCGQKFEEKIRINQLNDTIIHEMEKKEKQ